MVMSGVNLLSKALPARSHFRSVQSEAPRRHDS